MSKKGYLYIITNKAYGTLYIGVTSNLTRRFYEHKHALVKGFSQKYKLKKLVYFEEHMLISQAIKREKRMKDWKRKWKIDLIEQGNPDWRDLYENILN